MRMIFGEGLSLGGIALKKLKPHLKHHYLLKCIKVERYRNIKNRRTKISTDPKVVDKRDFWALKEEDPVFNFLYENDFGKKNSPKIFIDKHYSETENATKELNIAKIKIPNNFDLIENTDESIEAIRKIFYLGSKDYIHGFDLDQSNCKKMSLCACTLLNTIVLSIAKKNEIENKDFMIGGKLNSGENMDVFEMVHASGLLKILEFENNQDYKKVIESPEFKLIKTLDLLTPEGSHILPYSRKIHSESTHVSKQITTYLNDCLSTQNLELNIKGKRTIGNIIGETINNCTLHTGLDFENWFCMGYSKYLKPYTKCSLVIFNFGNTLYESLKYNSEDSKIPDRISERIRSIKGYKKFIFTEENLWTLFALQDGVSRCYNDTDGKDRGTGTIRLIKTFQSIGNTFDGKKANMAIISGKTKILFDDNYSISEKLVNGSPRDIIAFNRNNNLLELPDKMNVQTLKNKFPGTLISLEFYLDNKYLSRK